jgi:acetyl-CoA C-acetyltransferase
MLRLLEPANQVRGTAGDYQVEGARVALGQAYGGASNYFAMWIVSSEPNPTFS